MEASNNLESLRQRILVIIQRIQSYVNKDKVHCYIAFISAIGLFAIGFFVLRQKLTDLKDYETYISIASSLGIMQGIAMGLKNIHSNRDKIFGLQLFEAKYTAGPNVDEQSLAKANQILDEVIEKYMTK